MMGRVPKIAAVTVSVMIAAKVGMMTASAETGEDPAAEIVTEQGPVEDLIQARETLPEMLAIIAAERSALDQRRASLDAKEADLMLVQEAVIRQNSELSDLRDEISSLLESADLGHGNDLEKLVKIYSSMKPQEAGEIMADMDLEVATMVIAAMRERDSGPILANMDAGRARTISRIIYERSKLPGDQRPVPVSADG